MTVNIDQLPIDFGAEAARLYNRFYPLFLRQAWADATEQLGLELAFDLDNPFVQEVLETIAERVTMVVDSTKDEIRALVGRQADEGWSIARLADEIAQLAETSAPRRALLISRTESATAYSNGSIAAWKASGVVDRVEWLLGPESCELCQDVVKNTPTAPLGESFHNGAKIPMHPNCTCSYAPLVSEGKPTQPSKPFADAEAADAWGQEAFSDWRNTLSADEIQEIKLYQSTEYRRINAALRSGDALDADDRDTVRALDQALKRGAVDRDVVAYRGFSSQSMLDKFDSLAGSTIDDRAFVSTSLDVEQGKRFARYAAEDGIDPIIAEIRVPKGTSGAYLEGVLSMKEYELLLPRNTSFRVVETYRDDDGVRRMVLEVINGNG